MPKMKQRVPAPSVKMPKAMAIKKPKKIKSMGF